MASHQALALREVSKTVISGGAPLSIVQDISLTVMAGESVAIVGASGSGKSTLLGPNWRVFYNNPVIRRRPL